MTRTGEGLFRRKTKAMKKVNQYQLTKNIND